MKKILLALAALTLGSPALAAIPNPPPLASNESIVDRADLLTEAQEAALEGQIREIYNRTHHHIVVLTMPTLDGAPVQDYINNAFRFYKIGNKTRNDGVLLLVSMSNPRRLQIEVGYGLEGVLTDLRSTVITDSMVPLMKAGKPADAIVLGVTSIGNEISQEVVTPQQLAASTQPTAVEKAQSKDAGMLVLFIIGGILLVGGIILLLNFRKAKREEEARQARYAEQAREREAARLREAEEARIRAATQPKPAPVRPTPPASTYVPSRPKPAAPVGRTPTSARTTTSSTSNAAAAVAAEEARRRARRDEEEREARRRRDREEEDRRSRDSWSSSSSYGSSSSSSSWGSSSSSYDSGSSSSSYDSGGSSGGGGGGSDW
jgi:uncharacterized protein